MSSNNIQTTNVTDIVLSLVRAQLDGHTKVATLSFQLYNQLTADGKNLVKQQASQTIGGQHNLRYFRDSRVADRVYLGSLQEIQTFYPCYERPVPGNEIPTLYPLALPGVAAPTRANNARARAPPKEKKNKGRRNGFIIFRCYYGKQLHAMRRDIQNGQMSGILGAAWKALGEEGQKPWAIMSQYEIGEVIKGALTPKDLKRKTPTGEMVLNMPDELKNTGWKAPSMQEVLPQFFPPHVQGNAASATLNASQPMLPALQPMLPAVPPMLPAVQPVLPAVQPVIPPPQPALPLRPAASNGSLSIINNGNQQMNLTITAHAPQNNGPAQAQPAEENAIIDLYQFLPSTSRNQTSANANTTSTNTASGQQVQEFNFNTLDSPATQQSIMPPEQPAVIQPGTQDVSFTDALNGDEVDWDQTYDFSNVEFEEMNNWVDLNNLPQVFQDADEDQAPAPNADAGTNGETEHNDNEHNGDHEQNGDNEPNSDNEFNAARLFGLPENPELDSYYPPL